MLVRMMNFVMNMTSKEFVFFIKISIASKKYFRLLLIYSSLFWKFEIFLSELHVVMSHLIQLRLREIQIFI